MLLTATTGFVNLPNGSAKVHLFVVPTLEHPFSGKEVNIGIAAKQKLGIRVQGAVVKLPAAPGLRDETGTFTQATYDLPEGTVVKVFGLRSGGFGEMRVMASQFIQMRQQAAFRRMSAVLITHERVAFNRAPIQGRFDLLSPGDARNLGVQVNPMYEGQFYEGLVSRMFEIAELEPEIAAPARITPETVTNSKGEEVVVARTRKGRALDL
jgi:hypothetical protein